MQQSLKEILRKKIIPVTFERTIGMFGATTIGIGALMGAGIYVLIGMASDMAGPSVWLSYVICGGLAYLTTLLYAELARIAPASGGGYAYAYHALGSTGGFVTGWFLALGSVFACGLYAIGFAEYFTTILGYDVPGIGVKGVAILLVVLSAYINSKGSENGDNIQNILTWGNLSILLALIIFSVFYFDVSQITPMFPKGFSGTGSAISIIYISFFGFQLIANNTDEIKKPEKTVPNAMKVSMGVSFFFNLAIALTAILVIPWKELASTNAPLVQVATKSFGGYGWLIISIGGVLASAGALNSTLLSQGRQVYVMGKNRFLPELLGKLNESTKTPKAAIIAGAILVGIFILFFDLSFIAKSANFCLLASLLPVSLALRKIYKSEKIKLPLWKRFLPEVSLVANIGLLLTLDWISLSFGLQLGLVGVAVFFFYARKTEKRAKGGMHIALSEENKPFLTTGTRILIPTANPKTQAAIFSVSEAMLTKTSGEIVALSVVNTPKQMSFQEALSDADQSIDIIGKAEDIAKEKDNIKIKSVIRASHNIPKGIVHAAEEESCNLIMMGYAGNSNNSKNNLMEEVLQLASTNTIFLKLNNEERFIPKKIAVALGSKLNLDLMVNLAGAMAVKFGGEITFLNILPTDFTIKQKSKSNKTIIEAIEKHTYRTLYNVRMFSSENAQETLVNLSKEYDVLIIGTTKVRIIEKAVIGSFATRVAENAHCPVAIVRVIPGAKKMMKKL